MLEFDFTPYPTLHTKRLTLRAHKMEDVNDLWQLRSNDEVRKYLDRPKRSLKEIEKMIGDIIRNIENNEAITWVINLHGQEKMIGDIGFWRIDRTHHRGEVGYILSPKYWGQGLMSEALQVILKYGFEKMKLHSVEANVNPNNAASIRLLEKAGFKKEAHFTENYYGNGKFLDSAIYSLLEKWFKKV